MQRHMNDKMGRFYPSFNASKLLRETHCNDEVRINMQCLLICNVYVMLYIDRTFKSITWILNFYIKYLKNDI